MERSRRLRRRTALPPSPKPSGRPGSQRRKRRRPKSRASPFVAVIPLRPSLGLVVLLIVLAAGYLFWNHSSHFESTDDAFIAARQFSVAPKVSGYVVAVPVTDNQHVNAGDVIARIDDRDYRIALEQAQAQVAANRAQVAQAQAGHVFAKEQATRFQALVKTGAGTVGAEPAEPCKSLVGSLL